MGHNEVEQIERVLDRHQEETRVQFSELRESTKEMTDSVSKLTTLFGRMEERHISQDHGLKRVGKVVDDHESRIRVLEKSVGERGAQIKGGWKVATTVGVVLTFAFTAAFTIANYLVKVSP